MGSALLRVYVHLVWATHERRPLLDSTLEPIVHESMRQRCAQGGTSLLALGGVEDHVHLLVVLPAAISLAQTVGDLKGWSSYQANHQVKRPAPFRWQRGYAAFSVSDRGVDPVARYIAHQREHHRRQAGGPWELDP